MSMPTFPEGEAPQVPVDLEIERLHTERRNLTNGRWKKEQTIWNKVHEYVQDFDAQAYVVLQHNGEKDFKIFNSLPDKSWTVTAKTFQQLMMTEFPVPELRTPQSMGLTKKQQVAMGLGDYERERPRRSSAEEIAAYLSGPCEEIKPGDLTVRGTRRQTVFKNANMEIEIAAHMPRRRTVQPVPRSLWPAGLLPAAASADAPAGWSSHGAYTTDHDNKFVSEHGLAHTRLPPSAVRQVAMSVPGPAAFPLAAGLRLAPDSLAPGLTRPFIAAGGRDSVVDMEVAPPSVPSPHRRGVVVMPAQTRDQPLHGKRKFVAISESENTAPVDWVQVARGKTQGKLRRGPKMRRYRS